MTTDDRAEKPTDDAPDFPLIEVEVPRDTAQEAARMANKQDLALEDAIARLTVFDYPRTCCPRQQTKRTPAKKRSGPSDNPIPDSMPK